MNPIDVARDAGVDVNILTLVQALIDLVLPLQSEVASLKSDNVSLSMRQ